MEDTPVTRPEGPANSQPALEELLWREPTAFAFFQAVHLLECLNPGRQPVGGDTPVDEVVRFAVNPQVAFTAAEIQDLQAGLDDEPPRMVVNFLGLTGPVGVLPLEYSALVAEQSRARNYALRDFLDIFHHRIISLLYLAWENSQFPAAYERRQKTGSLDDDGRRGQRDRLTSHLMDLIGMGAEGVQRRLPVPDESLLPYTGLLAMRSRPAVALQQMLEDYFDVPVEIEQFVGAWYPVPADAYCELDVDDGGPSRQLGMGAVVGDEIWDPQARARVRLGPLTRRQYDRFLPGGSDYQALGALTRLFVGDELDMEVQLVLARDEVPWCALGVDDGDSTPLGWCTWLRTGSFSRDPDETTLTLSTTTRKA